MEAIIGPIVAVLISVGYTKNRARNHRIAHESHQEEYKALVERVDVLEQNLGRNMLAAMLPMSKSIKELQEQVGIR